MMSEHDPIQAELDPERYRIRRHFELAAFYAEGGSQHSQDVANHFERMAELSAEMRRNR